MENEAGHKAIKTVENYRRALKFLEECGDFTYEKLKEAHEIAGIDVPDYQLRSEWSDALAVLPLGGRPGGREMLRSLMKKELKEGISTFKALARKLGVHEKKWWRFWR